MLYNRCVLNVFEIIQTVLEMSHTLRGIGYSHLGLFLILRKNVNYLMSFFRNSTFFKEDDSPVRGVIRDPDLLSTFLENIGTTGNLPLTVNPTFGQLLAPRHLDLIRLE